jgi:hypothetical protein
MTSGIGRDAAPHGSAGATKPSWLKEISALEER